MKLLVDAGNSRIKWQLRDETGAFLSGFGELESDAVFAGMTEKYWHSLSAISVSTVRSESAREELEKVLAGYSSCPVRFFWTQHQFGSLTCAYENPQTMGADRWHALVGAWHLVQDACVVVDAGTAITIDWVDGRGQHLGGYILPGRNMMTRSLHQSTARVLFDPEEALALTTPGRSTAECVFHGTNWLLQALASQLGREVAAPVLLTGGDGPLIKKALDESAGGAVSSYRLYPDLVLDGLALREAE